VLLALILPMGYCMFGELMKDDLPRAKFHNQRIRRNSLSNLICISVEKSDFFFRQIVFVQIGDLLKEPQSLVVVEE
jgi:hypothetical protein